MNNFTIYKKRIVMDAILIASQKCKATFEIPMIAISIINSDNRLRKKPIRVSYDYVYNLMHEMIRAGLV